MSGIILDCILVLIIGGNAAFAYKQGLTKVIYGLLSGIVSLVLVFLLYTPVSNFVINNTNIPQKMEQTVYENVRALFEKEEIDDTNPQRIQEDNEVNTLVQIFASDNISGMMTKSKDQMIQYMVGQIVDKVIRIVVCILLYIIIRILMFMLKKYMDAIADLPFIKNCDEVGGLLYGFVKGLFLVYVLLAILLILMPNLNSQFLADTIQSSIIAEKMFNNNILLRIIF